MIIKKEIMIATVDLLGTAEGQKSELHWSEFNILYNVRSHMLAAMRALLCADVTMDPRSRHIRVGSHT